VRVRIAIADGVSISDRYPYSDPLARNVMGNAVLSDNLRQIIGQNSNYMRDAVKVVIDAHDGTPQFFVVDEQDPVLATYRQIFPNLFIGSDRIPAAIKAHFRYPLDYFQAQAQMYQAYHMANSEVFYNREDLWRFPQQVYEGDQRQMQPYYIIMRLPDAEQEEFILIIPFTPVNKDNMVAWMAARSDGENYGRLLLYEFPKQELVYGPSQVDARIDQNPDISQQLTLWSQEGSRVIRGDLLVIPIQQSLLYVEPVYLRAEQGELPELKRVIVAYGDQTVMANNLETALATVFGAATSEAIAPEAPAAEAPISPNLDPQLVQSAITAYEQGQAALRSGDWQRYGETQQELETLLQQLNQQAAP
ncbi:MAG: COG1615 family transporter, partial [Leptolyngbya sp. SIO4C5]|nr:COG1615 family transporter [Leptolyngbya sp. SIO4C5]